FDLKAMFTVGNHVPQPAAFFARSALQSAGYLDEQWHMIMDYELCIRLGICFPSSCLPQTLAKFRDHAHSKTRSRFEATAKELIHYVTGFNTDKLPPRELQALKRATVSRVHFEWALAYLVQGPQEKPKACNHLLTGVRLDPRFALRRPKQVAYIIKE